MNTGKSLALALIEKGLKKKDLATGLGVSQATVSTLIKNQEWSGKMLKNVCAFLEMEASEFIALGE